ncbi:hypothetical protein MMC22_007727 [Lobaria immixta]|nr:hypothetical protein [Lobaria immixta]
MEQAEARREPGMKLIWLSVVSQYSFGHDNKLLGDAARLTALRDNLSKLLLGVKFNQRFPWIVDAREMLPLTLGKFLMPPGKIRSEIQRVLDDKSNDSNGGKYSIFYELCDNPSLSPSGKTLLRLEHESTLLVMAGTGSTAKSRAIAHFHLLANPQCMAKLRAELQTDPETASWTELEQLPYLNDVIAEGNRLSFGVTARVCRIASDEILDYKGPDRWLGREGYRKTKISDGIQQRWKDLYRHQSSPHAELFLAIAALWPRYDMKLFVTIMFAYPKLDFERRESNGARKSSNDGLNLWLWATYSSPLNLDCHYHLYVSNEMSHPSKFDPRC